MESWTTVDEKSQKSYDNDKTPRITDLYDFYSKDNYTDKYKTIRLVGPIYTNHFHMVKIRVKAKDDPSKTIERVFYAPCLNYIAKQDVVDTSKNCPYCAVGLKPTIRFYQNAIIRELEENPPVDKGTRTAAEKELKVLGDKKFYCKESKTSSAWTPVRMIEIPKALTSKLRSIEEFNKYKDEETGERKSASPSDLKYGVDLFIKYCPNKAAGEMYDIQRDVDSGKTPVTNEMRKEYLFWDFKIPEYDEESVRRNFIRNAANLIVPDEYQSILDKIVAEHTTTSEKKEKQSKPIESVSIDDDDDLDDIEPTPSQTAFGDEDLDDVEIESSSSQSYSDDEFEDL